MIQGSKKRIYYNSIHASCENQAFLLSKINTFISTQGLITVDQPDAADVLIIGSCCVTDSMLNHSETMVKQFLEKYPEKDIIYFGCAVTLSKSIQSSTHFHKVSHENITIFNQLFPGEKTIEDAFNYNLFKFREYQEQGYGNDCFVMISQGCNNNCSYCNIKLVKGSVRSNSIAEIINNIQNIIATTDNKTITLLADDCGSYGIDIGETLPRLIETILGLHPELKVKLYNIFPGFFLEYFTALSKYIENGKIVSLTIPVQSGSARILKLMNRNYDLNRLQQAILTARTFNPTLTITTHMLVNFPTETLDEANESLAYAKLFDHTLFIQYGNNTRTKANQYISLGKEAEQLLSHKFNIIQQAITAQVVSGIIIKP